MATTLTGFEFARRVLRGFSGPQPLGGTAQRAAEAHAAMLASSWVASADGPSIPAHHYDTASPAPGDAYRQTFGYDESTRTERSACGAVCYSIKIPADALTGEACSVSSVSATLVGDRYLECGAIMAAFLSDDATPPAWADILAAPSTAALLAATSAEATVKPNKRADKSATATVSLSAAAKPYLHLVLRVADYLVVRDAWHEGGAMLDPSTVSVAFSRDVEPDVADGAPLDVGLLAANGISAEYALKHLPLASVWANWTLVADPDAFAGLAAATDEAKIRNLLSFIYNSPDLYDGREAGSVLSDSATNIGKTGVATVMTVGVYGFCALVSHGVTAGRTYSGLTLENPINPTGSTAVPYRLLVYALSPLNVFGESPSVATPLPWWGDILSKDFRDGRASSLRALREPMQASGASVTDSRQSSGVCQSISVTPLAALDVDGEVSEIHFAAPYKTGELATILIALVPNAAPALDSVFESHDVTVTLNTSGKVPNSGATAATRSGNYATLSTYLSINSALGFCRATTLWLPCNNKGTGIPTVKVENGRYVWASRNAATFTDHSLLEVYLGGIVTIDTGTNAGQYRWVTNGSSGTTLYYNGSPPHTSVSWSWSYLGNYSGFDLARLTGSCSLSNVPVMMIKLDENGDDTATILFGSISSVNLTFGLGGEFTDTSRFPSGMVMAAQDYKYSTAGTDFFGEAFATYAFASNLVYPSGTITYSFANATLNTPVDASILVEGTASFTRNGVAYEAELSPATVTAPLTITYKSGGAHDLANDPDKSFEARANYTLPQMSQTLLFRGEDGTALPATVSLPSRTVYMAQGDPDMPSGTPGVSTYHLVSAKEIYMGWQAPWNKWTDIVADGATQSGKGLSQTIDVGTVTLYE